EAAHGNAPRRSPRGPGGHVAPPAVVEAEEDEDHELGPEDDQDRALEERGVERWHAVVEAELEGEPPRGGHQACIRGQLPDPVPVDGDHYAAFTAAASRSTETTSCWISGLIPTQSGRARFSRAARSVSGS